MGKILLHHFIYPGLWHNCDGENVEKRQIDTKTSGGLGWRSLSTPEAQCIWYIQLNKEGIIIAYRWKESLCIKMDEKGKCTLTWWKQSIEVYSIFDLEVSQGGQDETPNGHFFFSVNKYLHNDQSYILSLLSLNQWGNLQNLPMGLSL